MRGFALACLLCTVCAVPLTSREKVERINAPQVQDGVINVHMVPHTHDDVGWLKTVDEYFAGKNQTIQHASVHRIISSVMDSLAKNPERKFVYVEMAFFWRWWQEQNEQRRDQVRNFVKTGQLEFINGGWCMHDEATTHYQSMIDQTTEGHQFIKNTFDFAPSVQWQIDPFGHSSGNAELSAQMGLKSLFFARADYLDFEKRRNDKTCELMWHPMASFPDWSIFTHMLYQHYGPPPGFDWDVYTNDEPIQDDPELEDYNVQSRLADFVNDCKDRASKFASSNIIMTMGSDFQYTQAEDQFQNIDKLIKYSKMYLNGTLNVFYSTPSIYTKAVMAEIGSKLPTKTDDFFPYGDSAHAFWTGYFTSRPAFKRYERYAMAFMQSCKQIEASSSSANASWPLREAMGIAQHHDAVSGTEKQHVADDYAKRIAVGIESCDQMMGQEGAKTLDLEGLTFNSCHLLNVSVCEPTVGAKSTDSVMLTIYNSLAVSRKEFIRIPVSSSSGASVVQSDGTKVVTQVIQNSNDTVALGALEGGAANTGNYTVVFEASIPARGYSAYRVDFNAASTHPFVSASVAAGRQQTRAKSTDDVVIGNSLISLTFSGKTGRVKQMTYKPDNTVVAVDQQFLQYFSSVGNSDSDQRSGAYIFRPNQQSADVISRTAVITVTQGPLVQEVHQDFGNNITQTVRVYADKPYAEFEWTVGPIGCHDGWGKEIISRFSTNVESDGVFFTDSNGREMQRRVRDYQPTWDVQLTEPVSQNYYPVNTAMYIQDSNTRVTVVNDRSQGGSSLADGQLELMVHRRTVQDDSRGVGEPIADPGVDGRGLIVRGKHFLLVSDVSSGPALHKQTLLATTYEPVLMFARTTTSSSVPASVSFMTGNFPSNIHLLTFQALAQDRSLFLVRVNHLYQIDEGTEAASATVSLDALFPSKTISSVVEMNLSGNQQATKQDPQTIGAHTTTLAPMQIRTFFVHL